MPLYAEKAGLALLDSDLLDLPVVMVTEGAPSDMGRIHGRGERPLSRLDAIVKHIFLLMSIQ